jgi:two-component system NtrC family sensor kinase
VKRARWFFLGASFLALAALLAFLYGKTRAFDPGAYFQDVALLRQLKQLDAQWELNALKSKSGLTTDYDPLVDPLVQLNGLRARLDRLAVGPDGAAAGPLAEAAVAFSKAVQDKTELIEQFKSHNSILRNSLLFLPTAAADVQQRIDVAKTANANNHGALNGLAAEVNRILLAILVYNQAASDQQAARIKAELAKLADANASIAPEVSEALDIFAAHASTVLREQTTVTDLLNSIATVPASIRLDEINNLLNENQREAAAEAQRYRQYLVVFSAILMVLLLYVVFRLVRSYAEINRVNRALKDANEGLEQKVAERTQELSQALKDLKESEAQLIQNEKMSSLGQMVSGVAHEINTPLAYVKGNLEIVGSRLKNIRHIEQLCTSTVRLLSAQSAAAGDVQTRLRSLFGVARDVANAKVSEEFADLVQDAIHGVSQISELVVNLKNFSRLDRSAEVGFNLHEGIDSTLLIARHLLKGRIEVRKNYGDIPSILCSPSQINQVVLNLVTNAAQAIAENGTITISTARHDQRTVRIDVADTGTGIAADILPKIFDPFFTTKEIGSGTGLGLSIAHKIVKQHGGRIEVRSEVGRGSCFTILLPLRDADNALASRKDAAPKDKRVALEVG